jgi:hypothetical protein
MCDERRKDREKRRVYIAHCEHVMTLRDDAVAVFLWEEEGRRRYPGTTMTRFLSIAW